MWSHSVRDAHIVASLENVSPLLDTIIEDRSHGIDLPFKRRNWGNTKGKGMGFRLIILDPKGFNDVFEEKKLYICIMIYIDNLHGKPLGSLVVTQVN